MEADTCLCDSMECGMEHETLTLHAEGDDDDEEDEDEEDDPDLIDVGHNLHKRRSVASCLKSRPCTVCMYLAIVLMLLSSTVAIVVVGILVVAPYHRASGFVMAPCSPVVTVRDTADRRCSCGKGCHSQYPCVKVTVQVYPAKPEARPSDYKAPWTTVLSEDESMLRRQCSYYPTCKSSSKDNQAAVKEYVQKYGIAGHNYSCMYNPSQVTDVIRTKRFKTRHVVHGLVWPIAILTAAIFSLVFTLKFRGCNFL